MGGLVLTAGSGLKPAQRDSGCRFALAIREPTTMECIVEHEKAHCASGGARSKMIWQLTRKGTGA